MSVKSCLSPEALSSMGWGPRLFCSSLHTTPHPTPMPNPEPGSQVSLRNCVLNEGAEHMREEIARCRITLEIFIVASPMWLFEGTTRRGTATPVHRPQRPAGSTHSTMRGLRPPSNSRGHRGSLPQTRRGLTLLSQLCRDPAVGVRNGEEA